ncbi:MAG: class 1 fructose-bisphosphatase [bacterium]
MKKGIDLRRHITMTEKEHPEATGEFSQLLSQITLAAKIVSREVNKAGLVDILGLTDDENVFGEQQAQLDVYANNVFTKALIHNGGVCVVGSEEEEDPVKVRKEVLRGKYAVTLDPLDGSSNIDYNISIGTIFGIYRRISSDDESDPGKREDLLQAGRELVAAGYVIYGSSTMLVYTTGENVYGFTLDSSIGEFLLSYPDIQIPSSGGAYSVNESYFRNWEKPVQESVKELRNRDYTSRYVGTLVSDVHRTLLDGGIFMYPREPDTPGKEQGKLRLLYEAAPLAYLVEHAGGRAIDGERDILDVKPEWLHQRTPLFIGSTEAVNVVEEEYSRSDCSVADPVN